VGAFVFVCRQLYNTCDGLLLLLPYDLPRRIAAAWKQVFFSLAYLELD